MSLQTKCPICDTLDNSVVVYPSNIDETSFSTEVFSARRLPDRRHYQWVRCITCSLLRSDPVLQIDLEKLYIESTFDYTTEIVGLKKTYMDLVKKNLRNKEFTNSIFEIGGGNGFFLEAAKDYGFKSIQGVEPSTQAINAARSDIKPYMIASIMKNGVLKPSSFEVGVMFHTLDHLPDPVQTLKDSCDALICGGVFIVAVHNERSWSAKLMKNRSPIIDVEHTHLYTPKTGKMIFEKAGFVDVTTGTYSNHYSLAYLLHLLPISRRLRRIILKSYIGLILSKIKVVVPLGNMWIVGTKP
jgi:2-polyprenyl-3-methyl-5-hydroxy-6-metoxy-1,4-benzoquinol methylase